ncbi:MAG: hypothetical protein U5R46_12240 [Gammaproteobacteria bacterium]|nr:hypothetical protein [Gammaproteobacteria bacterium]
MNLERIGKLLGGLLLAAAGPVWAIQGLNVSPGSVSINARVDFPTIRPDPATLPPSPTFRDLFRGTVPSVSFSPSSFSPTWQPDCDNEQAPATSQSGQFRLGGTVLAVNNANRTTGVPCNGVVPVPESVQIPNAVGDAIAQVILDARVPIPIVDYSPARLRGALESVAAQAVSGLVYQRTWQAQFSATGPKTDSVALGLSAQASGVIDLNLSRLVAFNGSSSTSSASFLGASTPVPVTWTGTVEQVGSGSNLTLRSDRYVVRTRSGSAIGQGNRPLTRSGIRSGQAVFNETIQLSSSQLLRARQQGGGLILERTLRDDFGNRFIARVPVNLTGPGQADFSISAMKCRFHDGSRVKIVQEGDPVHVVCDLRFDGPGGLLRGTWEVAEGGGNQLFFRPLQLYSNFVVGQNTVQISRTFTATGTGRHIVRFRVQEPELLSDQTQIQYYVGVSPGQVSAAALPSPVSVLSPPPNSVTETGLEVSWSDIPATATHVLIEFFTPAQLQQEPDPEEREQLNSTLLVRGDPTAGLVVPADRSRAEISRLVMDHLAGMGHVYMRVSALEDGIMVASSPLRRLNAR